jgi:hypothetical protein
VTRDWGRADVGGWRLAEPVPDPKESKSRVRRAVGAIAATVITVGAVVGGVAVWNGVAQAQDAHAAYVASDHTYSVAMADSRSDDQQVQAQAVERQHINDVNAQVQAAEDAKAAAAAAAAQAAAQAAAAAAAEQQTQEQAAADDTTSSDDGSGRGQQAVTCPPGSQANSGTTINGVRVDTSCFPEICFHLVLPDPAHPECVTAFKP